MQITSIHNPYLTEIRRAAARGQPTSDGYILAEGPHLLTELLRSPWEVKEVFVTAEAKVRHAALLAGVVASQVELPDRTLAALATTETNQGICALARPKHWTWEDMLVSPSLLVILDGIQDPGNAGTITRSAEAFGATGLVLAGGTARISNGKLLRASAGSLFRVPFLEEPSRRLIVDRLTKSKLKVYALSTTGYRNLEDLDLSGDCAVVVGSEAAGVSSDLLACSQTVHIRTQGVDSLNAGVACSIVLHQAAQQRFKA